MCRALRGVVLRSVASNSVASRRCVAIWASAILMTALRERSFPRSEERSYHKYRLLGESCAMGIIVSMRIIDSYTHYIRFQQAFSD